MKINSTISEIQFPTHDNGLVGCVLRLERTEETVKHDLGGIGIGIGNYTLSKMRPFLSLGVGNQVEVELNEKSEIVDYKVLNEQSYVTRLPFHCATCGGTLRNIEDRKNKKLSAVICTNLIGCTAQSRSAVFRLLSVATGRTKDQQDGMFFMFAEKYPDAPITHLSDFRIFLTSDPSTDPRLGLWGGKKVWWEMEHKLWLMLKSEEMASKDFWYIGFNLRDVDIDPRTVLQHPDLEFPAMITDNIDKVEQLVKFFDFWCEKSYVSRPN